MGAAVSIRTLQPGGFYLVFPDLVTLGFVFADGQTKCRFDLNGDHRLQILPIDTARCVEIFNGSDLSFQIDGHAARGALKTGSLFVTKAGTGHFLAALRPDSQARAYIDMRDWKLVDILPDASCELCNNWKLFRAWDGMLVYEFH